MNRVRVLWIAGSWSTSGLISDNLEWCDAHSIGAGHETRPTRALNSGADGRASATPETFRLRSRLRTSAGSSIRPGELHGATFASRRNVLEQIGGFDPALGAGTLSSSEDCDLLLRAWEAE
jgi:hypothetical protein